MKKHFAQRLAALLLIVVANSACATSYRGAAISGRVVDAQTKQPVKDVVVVAEWRIYGGSYHPDIIGRLLLQEAVTDEQGRYRFHAWGPLHADEGEIDRFSPILNFYKRGYKFTSHDNQSYVAPYVKLPDPLISEWDGKTVELVPFKGKLSRDSVFVEVLGAPLLYSLESQKCAWQQMPRMTAELMKRRREYEEKGVFSSSLPHREGLYWNGKCADPDTLLGEYVHD